MEWTKEQQKVIEERGKNLLVSAAAGSGKTAVLVERIIEMITEKDNPVDIDRLLIVTFTNAAAAEMKERISKAIEKKLIETPDNMNLQKQASLVHSAQITTIHSFCLYVIRNHFNAISLDPSFRIAEEAELTLMKSDVLEAVLERYYEEGKDEFLNFVENFGTGKTDDKIMELILNLYHFSMSYPWPEEWLIERKKDFCLTSVEDMETAGWMTVLMNYLNTVLIDLQKRLDEAILICKETDGPEAYLSALYSDQTQIVKLLACSSYKEYSELFTEFQFARLSGKKEEGVSDEKKSQVKAIREEVKKAIGDFIKNYFFQSEEEMFDDIVKMKESMEVLINLCIDFTTAFQEKKTDKNIVDFNDLEHYALSILVEKKDGNFSPTLAADEYSLRYAEIMVDEYQDSNLVQETILSSISGERFKKPNRFMVGDVKQSIYKFRLARPEIFMEKFNTYHRWVEDRKEVSDENRIDNQGTDNSNSLRIDLHKNFRSRDVVLDSINYIFSQIMTKKLGNIEYDEQAALYPGADFSEIVPYSKETELLLVHTESDEDDELKEEREPKEKTDAEENEYTAKELEARAIAVRIRELTDAESGLLIKDKRTNKYRRAVFGDVVILLRSISGWADVFADTLAAEGIPCHTETQSGYFQTLEIRTVLDLLRVIDNPRQDIPFAAVLHSPIVGLKAEDLASIRIPRRKITMYEAALEYHKEETNQISNTLKKFFDKLNQYREMVYHFSIHELIIKVLEDTGYYNFVKAMPSGEKRAANIDMLIQRAISFETTSYSGLFHFIRYIEKLNKYEVDFGEAKISGEDDKTVRIMSIHKSKGLEFPICFVSGMGKNFNNQDSRSNVLLHPDLGIGPDYMDNQLRVKGPTLLKKVIQKQLVLENLGEELRILYVAFTRAKEKLILTGGIKDMQKILVKWSSVCNAKSIQLMYFQLSNASSYFDFVIPSLMRSRDFEPLLNQYGLKVDSNNILYHHKANFMVREFSKKEIVDNEYKSQLIKKVKEEVFYTWDNSIVYDEKIRTEIKERLEYQYPYQAETNIHTKLTVSELKKASQLELEDLAVPIKGISKKTNGYPVPKFVKEEKAVEGADLGTLYHSVLERIDFTLVNTTDDIKAYLSELLKKEIITEKDFLAIKLDKLHAFMTSSIVNRMRQAQKNGKLFKERQFVMGVKAKEINMNMSSEELILVQGIIDVYFEEDGGFILLDYKTDILEGEDKEENLRKRYKVQLNYYKKALEQLTGKAVKESIIYSFDLDKEIILLNN